MTTSCGKMRGVDDRPAMIAIDQRSLVLDRAVNRAVAGGGRLVSRGQVEAVVEFGRRPSHILHLLLTLVTCGLWLLVWLIDTLTSPVSRRTLMVDEYGRAWISGKRGGWQEYPL
jgi:hypothetical protein